MSGNLGNNKKGQPLKVASSNEVAGSQVEKVQKQIVINLFFDGTGNNKHNTDLRLQDEETEETGPQTIMNPDTGKKELVPKAPYLEYKERKDEVNRLNAEIQRYEFQKRLHNTNRKSVIAHQSADSDGFIPLGRKGREDQNIEFVDQDDLMGEYRSKIAILSQEMKAIQKSDGDHHLKLAEQASYYNEYSNVALLEMESTLGGEPYQANIYIEGAGTRREKKDDTRGLGFATGPHSGLIKRVGEAFDFIKKTLEGNDELKKVIVNVFGFSRGSFYARVFCCALKNDGLPELLQKKRAILKQPSSLFKIHFVGLYDTVSSYGLAHYNDQVQVPMSISKREEINHVVHFTAENEYRYHFPLTPIYEALEDGIGLELRFPGAHSNIGGAYPDHWKENKYYLSILEPEKHSRFLPTENPLFSKILIKPIKLLSLIKFFFTDNQIFARPGEIPWMWWANKGYYRQDQLAQDRNIVVGYRTVRHHHQYILLKGMRYLANKHGYIQFGKGSRQTEVNERVDWFEAQKSIDPTFKQVADEIHQFIEDHGITPAPQCIPITIEAIFPDEIEKQRNYYNRYICNSVNPILEKLKKGIENEGGKKSMQDVDILAGDEPNRLIVPRNS